MCRALKLVGLTAVLVMLAAPPSSGKIVRPKPGPWVGRTIAFFAPPGSPDLAMDYGSEMSFTLKRIRGGDNPRYRVKNFDADAPFNPFTNPGCLGYWGFHFSAPATHGASLFRFRHSQSEREILPTGFAEKFEAAGGAFHRRLKAKGTVTAHFTNEGTDMDGSCDTGEIRWKAHHK